MIRKKPSGDSHLIAAIKAVAPHGAVAVVSVTTSVLGLTVMMSGVHPLWVILFAIVLITPTMIIQMRQEDRADRQKTLDRADGMRREETELWRRMEQDIRLRRNPDEPSLFGPRESKP